MSPVDYLVRELPKAELHVHIEGTLEPELKFELAERNGVVLAYESVAAMRNGYVFTSPESFLSAFYEGASVLVTQRDFRDLAYAYLARARRDNVKYAELMFDAQSHVERGIRFATLVEGLQAGQVAAQHDYGIRSSLILCLMREKSVASAMQALDSARHYQDCIAGIGLVGVEPLNPPLKFREVFARARSEGYKLSAHCGPDVEGVVDHIWQCVRDLKLDRIDHGVNAVADRELIDVIAHKGICLNACPVRRHEQSWYGPRHAQSIRTLIDAGVQVTINTDDPAYFLSRYLNDVLLDLCETLVLSESEILSLIRCSFEQAWLPVQQRAAFLAELDAAVSNLTGMNVAPPADYGHDS